MAKIIGLMCLWANEPFSEPAMRQAIDICDEVNVCVAPHSKALKKFEDDTLKTVKRYKDKVNIIKYKNNFTHHATAKADILNKMCRESKYFEEGNFLWILDGDEFYPQKSIEYIKDLLQKSGSNYNQFCIEEKYFYLNFKYYLLGEHYRIFRIEKESVESPEEFCFYPTQNWRVNHKRIFTVKRQLGMFHYGGLTNPWVKPLFWDVEYPGQPQNKKIEWFNKIFLNYDVERPQKWLKLNEQLFGIRSPWFSDSFIPDSRGNLFRYDGDHPKYVQHLVEIIKDSRTYYGR